jgi:hypothetical protein
MMMFDVDPPGWGSTHAIAEHASTRSPRSAMARMDDHGAPVGVITAEQMATFVAMRTRPAPPH